MRQVKGAARKATTKRRAPAKKKTSPRRRGNKQAAGRVWERRIEGARRFLERHTYLRVYALLSVLTIAVYGIWASGFVTSTGRFIGNQTHAVMMDAGFTVQRITITGQVQTSPGDVMDALEIEYGDPIFGLDLPGMRARVEQLDWVETATVVRALPGNIHVVITEREPYAVWQQDGTLRVITADGGVIESALAERYAALPRVVGAGANDDAALLLETIADFPGIAPRVRYAVRVGDRRWDLHLDNGVVVKLPEVGLTGSLHALVNYDRDHRLLARAVEVVDLRLGDRIVVTPLGDGAADDVAAGVPGVETET